MTLSGVAWWGWANSTTAVLTIIRKGSWNNELFGLYLTRVSCRFLMQGDIWSYDIALVRKKGPTETLVRKEVVAPRECDWRYWILRLWRLSWAGGLSNLVRKFFVGRGDVCGGTYKRWLVALCGYGFAFQIWLSQLSIHFPHSTALKFHWPVIHPCVV